MPESSLTIGVLGGMGPMLITSEPWWITIPKCRRELII